MDRDVTYTNTNTKAVVILQWNGLQTWSRKKLLLKHVARNQPQGPAVEMHNNRAAETNRIHHIEGKKMPMKEGFVQNMTYGKRYGSHALILPTGLETMTTSTVPVRKLGHCRPN